MKESTKNHIPLIIAVVIVGGIILALLIGYIVGRSRADNKGFAADMQKVCDSYNILKIVPDEPEGVAYKMYLNPDMWRGLSEERMLDYCSKIYIYTQNLAWEHKIVNEATQPIIWYYIDNGLIASGSAGKVNLE